MKRSGNFYPGDHLIKSHCEPGRRDHLIILLEITSSSCQSGILRNDPSGANTSNGVLLVIIIRR